MGLFDRFRTNKVGDAKRAPHSQTPAQREAISDAGAPSADSTGPVMPRLVAARVKLDEKDLAGAEGLYEEVLAEAGDRADVLVTISGDLGSTGHFEEIITWVAPRYDAERHGPATGLNILQAYLALRNPDAAQHILDILFDLKRPDLKERLHGFSNAIAELLQVGAEPLASGGTASAKESPSINIATVSKPIWAYGLESVEGLLPIKEGRLRRVAFAQLATPDLPDFEERVRQPEDELGRLSRAIPLWLAETFYAAPHYAPLAALGLFNTASQPGHYALMPAEWATENLRQIVDSCSDGLDYIFTGALRQDAGSFELVLRVWEVRNYRERKKIIAHWTPPTADEALGRLHGEILQFMEWKPAPEVPYAPPKHPRAWLETLGVSATLFFAEKKVLAMDQLPALQAAFQSAADRASDEESATIAHLTLSARARALGLPPVPAAGNPRDSKRTRAARTALGESSNRANR